MLKIDAAKVVNLLTDIMLPRGSGNKALYFELEATLVKYDPDFSKNEEKSAYVHLIVLRPKNYTTVFSSIQKKVRPLFDEIPLNEWNFNIHHDSCWRSEIDSLYTQVYFDLAKKLKEIPVKLEQRNNFCSFGPKFLMVETAPDETDKFNYKKKITRIEKA